jgi:hypothetical protein
MSKQVTGAGEGSDSFKPIKCEICARRILSIHQRHNGQPVVGGWVCGVCNDVHVIPSRVKVFLNN